MASSTVNETKRKKAGSSGATVARDGGCTVGAVVWWLSVAVVAVVVALGGWVLREERGG